MKKQLNEIKRMQQLAGILKESQLNEGTDLVVSSPGFYDSTVIIAQTKKGAQMIMDIVGLQNYYGDLIDKEGNATEELQNLVSSPNYGIIKQEAKKAARILQQKLQTLINNGTVNVFDNILEDGNISLEDIAHPVDDSEVAAMIHIGDEDPERIFEDDILPALGLTEKDTYSALARTIGAWGAGD